MLSILIIKKKNKLNIYKNFFYNFKVKINKICKNKKKFFYKRIEEIYMVFCRIHFNEMKKRTK